MNTSQSSEGNEEVVDSPRMGPMGSVPVFETKT